MLKQCGTMVATWTWEKNMKLYDATKSDVASKTKTLEVPVEPLGRTMILLLIPDSPVLQLRFPNEFRPSSSASLDSGWCAQKNVGRRSDAQRRVFKSLRMRNWSADFRFFYLMKWLMTQLMEENLGFYRHLHLSHQSQIKTEPSRQRSQTSEIRRHHYE